MLLLSFVKGLYFLSTTSLGKLQTVRKIQQYLHLFGVMKNVVAVLFMSYL